MTIRVHSALEVATVLLERYSPSNEYVKQQSRDAFFNKDRSYVVRDTQTGDVIQIGNRNDPNWIPAQTMQNPYRPR